MAREPRWLEGSDFDFGPSFWQALRRLRVEKNTRKYPAHGWWLPTEDVWPYREFERGTDNGGFFGGTPDTVENVNDIAESMHKSGQHSAGRLLFDPHAVDKADEGLYGMHLGEGNHRLAAARRLENPHYLVDFGRSNRQPNRERRHRVDSTPSGARRGVIARFGPGDHIPGEAAPDDFEEFKGKGIRAGREVGSPADRAIVKALGNKDAAKRILKAMGTAGKVLAPAAGVVGLLTGLQDPAEAMGATVDKAEGNRWAKKQMTPKMKRDEKQYYARKKAKQRAANPLTALLDRAPKG